jgi:hypothetical protein
LLYWCEAFRNPQVERTQVAVRYDPYDVGKAWAYVNHRWFECHSEYYAAFRGRSEKELMLAVEELRARRSQHSRRFYVSAKQLGGFLQSVESEELLLKQRRSDREARCLVDVVEGNVSLLESDREAPTEWSDARIDSSSEIEATADERAEYEEF